MTKRLEKIDLTGMIFGKLKVIKKDDFTSKTLKTLWYCECSCGEFVSVQSHKLRIGHKKSCGCFNLRNKDLTNKIFNKLRVIKKYNKVDNRKGTFWECLCVCGNLKVIIVSCQNLSSGSVQSCGCAKKEGISKKEYGQASYNSLFGKL